MFEQLLSNKNKIATVPEALFVRIQAQIRASKQALSGRNAECVAGTGTLGTYYELRESRPADWTSDCEYYQPAPAAAYHK
jgi:hypothetical protein